MKATLFVVGGTYDLPQPGLPYGALTSVTQRVIRSRYDIVWVDYPATYGNGLAYKQSLAAGRAALRAAIAKIQGTFSMIGYSQGAHIVGDIAAEIGTGAFAIDAKRMLMAGLIADPARSPGERDCYGITGHRGLAPFGVVAARVHQFANPLDPICSTKHGAMIRDVADITRMVSPNVGAWAADIFTQLAAQSWQNRWGAQSLLDIPRQIARIRECAADVRRYLPYDKRTNPTGGQHGNYDTPMYSGGPTYVTRCAQLLNESVLT